MASPALPPPVNVSLPPVNQPSSKASNPLAVKAETADSASTVPLP
jgi:hypothetical protein